MKEHQYKGFKFEEGYGIVKIWAVSETAKRQTTIVGNQFDANGYIGQTTERLADIFRMTDAILKCT